MSKGVYKRKPFSKSHLENLSKAHKGWKWKDGQREKYKKTMSNLGGYGGALAFKRIVEEMGALEKQGFKCVPIGLVIPDIIAVKDGKIYAIEVEYGTPNYEKYQKEDYKSYFEDVIWILRKRK